MKIVIQRLAIIACYGPVNDSNGRRDEFWGKFVQHSERESARQHKCVGGNETKNDQAIWRFKRRTENCDL